MPQNRPYKRTDRFGQNIQRELAQIMMREPLNDPDIQPVTITQVGMSKDLRVANVYVQMHASPIPSVKTVAALNRAAGYLRRQLAPRLNSRVIPRLVFHLDETLDALSKVADILGDIALEQNSDEPEE